MNKDEISDIVLELKFKLKISKIDLKTVDTFSIENDLERILLSRYLIEEIEENKVSFDSQHQSSVAKVKSIFKHLMGGNNYKVMEENEKQIMFKEIKHIFKVN